MADVLGEAKVKGIRIRNTEFVTTSEDWDDSLGVWFFYEKDMDIVKYEADGTTERIKQHFLEQLEASKTTYPFSKLPNVIFEFDSHENVVLKYQGNYFLRLR